jgi:hypothetical protein
MIGRQTHTYVELDISPEAFSEIKEKLLAADYGHAFMEDGTVIDMHGIAVKADPALLAHPGCDTVIDRNGTVHGKRLPDLRGIR